MSKNIFSEFDKQIKNHNRDIEYYRKLAPKLMPVIILTSSSADIGKS